MATAQTAEECTRVRFCLHRWIRRGPRGARGAHSLGENSGISGGTIWGRSAITGRPLEPTVRTRLRGVHESLAFYFCLLSTDNCVGRFGALNRVQGVFVRLKKIILGEVLALTWSFLCLWRGLDGIEFPHFIKLHA